jgi:predicted nuclease of restriction endonuclease-like (RecB) superfamily
MSSKKPSAKPLIPSVAEQPRLQRGRTDRSVMFPIAPESVEMPDSYAALLTALKQRIRQERLRVVLSSNAAMLLMYWDIGHSVIDRLSADLRQAFPDMKGFSPRNLKYMRTFAATWADKSIVQELLAQLTWYHNIALLEKLSEPSQRLWYARKTLEHGWSRNILAMQIEAQAISRHGKAQNNFSTTLPPTDSDMAVQVFKDPYLFDFLGTDAPRREKELEQGLINHIQKFLIELGQGFAFVGRQVPLEIGDSDFYLDLLFYHLKLRRYIVIELKARKFTPGDGSQLGMYMTAVDRLLAHPDDKPTLGLLLVREKNQVLVEYALSGTTHPISVAEWETQLTRALPDELRGSLPSIEAIERELGLDGGDEDLMQDGEAEI